jgi:hypothetical protein
VDSLLADSPQDIWDVRAALERRGAIGGSAPDAVKDQLEKARARLKD